jgi:hypothetical protein
MISVICPSAVIVHCPSNVLPLHFQETTPKVGVVLYFIFKFDHDKSKGHGKRQDMPLDI